MISSGNARVSPFPSPLRGGVQPAGNTLTQRAHVAGGVSNVAAHSGELANAAKETEPDEALAGESFASRTESESQGAYGAAGQAKRAESIWVGHYGVGWNFGMCLDLMEFD